MNPRREKATLTSVRGLGSHRLVQAFLRQEPREIKLSLAHMMELLLVIVMMVVLVVMLVLMRSLPKSGVCPHDGLTDTSLTRHWWKWRMKILDIGTIQWVSWGRWWRLIWRLRPRRGAVALRDVHGQEGAWWSPQPVVEVTLSGSLNVE